MNLPKGDSPALHAAVVRDQRLLISFRSDDATARELCDVLQTAFAARYAPTEENASALFKLGAEAVVVAAQANREEAARA